MPATAIKAHELTKWFGEAEARTYAVKEVSFEAYLNEMLYIVGPSGSGKTTLLSMISGILRPNSGSVLVEDEDIWTLSKDRIADFRLNKVGFVFQDYHLFPRLTSAENVAIPLILRKRSWNESMNEAMHYLEIVGLRERAHLPPIKLSGGEQQRVAIARAIVGRPDLLIFDEPTASLDGETGRRILEFIKTHILNEQRCIVVVTHDSRIFQYANRIIKMEDGRITGIVEGAFHEE
jgi:putative ABC transport system ATP-binding protein